MALIVRLPFALVLIGLVEFVLIDAAFNAILTE